MAVKPCANCGKPTRRMFCMARPCQNARARANYFSRYGPTEAAPCENCGTLTAVGGPKTERRWCMKAECRQAKRVWDYHQRFADPESEEVENRPCSNCGKKMLPRPKRFDDSPIGRWCNKKKCQIERDYEERRYAADRRYWFDELAALDSCPACPQTAGLRTGFAHPDFSAVTKDNPGGVRWCKELGDRKPGGYLAEFVKDDWDGQFNARLAVEASEMEARPKEA